MNTKVKKRLTITILMFLMTILLFGGTYYAVCKMDSAKFEEMPSAFSAFK